MKIGRGILGVVFLVGIAAVISNSPERAATIDVAHVYGPPAPPAPPSCKNSLSACADNREIANEWSGYSRLKSAAKPRQMRWLNMVIRNGRGLPSALSFPETAHTRPG